MNSVNKEEKNSHKIKHRPQNKLYNWTASLYNTQRSQTKFQNQSIISITTQNPKSEELINCII